MADRTDARAAVGRDGSETGNGAPLGLRQSAGLLLGVLVRLIILLGLVALSAQDVMAYRRQQRGVETGLAIDQPVLESPRTAINVALEQYATNLDLLAALSRVRDLGYGTLVQRFAWETLEPARGQYDWGAWDAVLALVQEQGLQVVAVLDGAPAWARAESEADNPSAPPEDPADLARFAGALAARFGDRILGYQIWDRPNIYPHWGKGPVDPAGYVALLQSVASSIRKADPEAVIVAGGLAPNTERSGRNMSDVQYLREIYRLGGAQWFDVLGVKAYGFWSGPYDRRVDEEVLNLSRLILLREEMVRHGDSACPVWALDGGWVALPEGWEGEGSPLGNDSASVQAARLQDAYARVQQEWPWMTLFGALHLQPASAEDDPLWGLSLLDAAGQPQPLLRELGAGLRDMGAYSPGRHRVSASLLPEKLPAAEERAVSITFVGSDLAVELGPQGLEGELRVLAPYERAVPLHEHQAATERYWVVRGQPTEEHTVTLVGTVAQIEAIRGLQVGARPDSATLWITIIASMLLAAWLVTGATQRLQLIGWRRPYRWVQRRVQKLDAGALVGLACIFALAMAVPGSMLRLGLLALYGLGALVRPDVALWVAVGSIPLAPLHVSLGPGSFSVTELALLCAVMARAGAALLGGERLASTRRPRLNTVDVLLVAFVLWTGVDAWNAEYQREALRELRTAVAEPALLYLLLRLTGDDLRLWERLVQVLYASAVGTALYALLRYPFPQGVIEAEGVRRARGFYGSPNNLALYLERLLPLGIAATTEGKGASRPRWTWGLGALLLLVAIVLTYSRGAWLLGIPAGLLALGLVRRRVTGRGLLIGGIVLVLCLIPLMQIERIGSLLNTQGGTTFLRLRLWESTWEMIRDHPWSGVGLDNFLYYYGDYIRPGAEIERWLSHPHNIILDLWVRTGLPGLLLYLGLLLAAVVPALKRWTAQPARNRTILAGLLGGLAAMLAHGLIDNAVFVPELAYWTMFVVAWLANAQRGQQDAVRAP